ncbi:hypothetical protein MNB_SM-5-1104 [hydrothermal vent metagenome]|uniref:PGAP1-like protein n=1 Tax=hydrothermal vent metagenome TaxID=652676 RepID=A0A1W1CYL5_9ZZZZ
MKKLFLLPLLLYDVAWSQNILFVHGLKSNADTFFKAASNFNDTVMKLGVSHRDANGTCYIGTEEINCSDIASNNTLAKALTISGLVDNFKTDIYFKDINVSDANLSMDNATQYTNQNFDTNVFILNLSNNINLSFEAQGKELQSVIQTITQATSDNNFVLVGHSMGGLAIRSYAQYYFDSNQTNLDEIITIGTPNKGVNYSMPESIYKASAYNLQSSSDDLARLNSTNLAVYNTIPFIAFVSTGYGGGILNGDLISGTNDDGVVSADSQTPPFDAKIVNFTTGIYHTKETTNNTIIETLKKYISDYAPLNRGWNLIGGTAEPFNLKDIDTAWSYNNGWSYYSNKATTDKYPKLTSIDGGFWIRSSKKRELNLIQTDTVSQDYNDNNWHLIKGYLDVNNTQCDNNFEIWKYKNNTWLTYPQIDGYATFTNVAKNEGAWIKCLD